MPTLTPHPADAPPIDALNALNTFDPLEDLGRPAASANDPAPFDDVDEQAFLDKFFMHLDGQLPPEDLPDIQHHLEQTPQAQKLARNALLLENLLREAFAE